MMGYDLVQDDTIKELQNDKIKELKDGLNYD